jgi:hypothetical protein
LSKSGKAANQRALALQQAVVGLRAVMVLVMKRQTTPVVGVVDLAFFKHLFRRQML